MFRRGRAAWALTLIVTLAVGWFCLESLSESAPHIDRAGEDAAEAEASAARRETRRRAFTADTKPLQEPELRAFFDRLGRVAARREARLGVELFDVSRLSASAAPGREVEAMPALVTALWNAVAAGFPGDGWDATQVLHVEILPGGAELLVAARHLTASGEALPFHWSLRRLRDEIQAYDLEDGRSGTLLSRQLRDDLEAERTPDVQDRLRRGHAAWREALTMPRPQEALTALEPAQSAPRPPERRLQVLLLEASLAVAADDRLRARSALTATEALRPHLPARDRLLAALALRDGNLAEAETYAVRYLAELGPEPQICLVLSKALVGQGRKAEAIERLAEAMTVLPNSTAVAEEWRSLTMMP